MYYYSTNNHNHQVSFREAVLNGLAPDGGLYMPSEIPKPDKFFIKSLQNLTFPEISLKIADKFVDAITPNDLQTIIEKTITFNAPLVSLSEQVAILELFHGPTLAFKDFGARFLANMMTYFNRDEDHEIIILVATSGDTGSAVAHAFYGCEGIKVGLLYPSGKVSKIQEQQLTTLGKNITAFEVEGTFDDCQNLVKNAFLDEDLRKKYILSSANSINIARLIPQSFYYFNAFARQEKADRPVIFSVPCGNFGNITAGIIASEMGLPVQLFYSALNSNKIFDDYLKTGKFVPKEAIRTLSNAMDVGNPSNFARISDIFNHQVEEIRTRIKSYSTSDDETLTIIQDVYNRHGYILDPHGAVGYAAWKNLHDGQSEAYTTIVLETAHPSKFIDVMPKELANEITIPKRLQESLDKPKKSTLISSEFDQFKSELLNGLS